MAGKYNFNGRLGCNLQDFCDDSFNTVEGLGLQFYCAVDLVTFWGFRASKRIKETVKFGKGKKEGKSSFRLQLQSCDNNSRIVIWTFKENGGICR